MHDGVEACMSIVAGHKFGKKNDMHSESDCQVQSAVRCHLTQCLKALAEMMAQTTVSDTD